MTTHVTGVNTQQTVQAKDPMVEQIKQETVAEAPKVVEAPKPVAAKPVVAVAPKTPANKEELGRHAGLDIGTMFIVAARNRGNTTEYKKIRNVFIELTQDQVKMLKLSGDTSYVNKGDSCYVLGDSAADIANIFGKGLRKPMEKGVIAAGELEAMEILKIMVGEVLGTAPEGGTCVISSPGDPMDKDFDALYHQAIVENIVSSYGWEVSTASESTAMTFSEAGKDHFSCLAISAGHGMTNISLVFKTIETLKFSVARGGSWIDDNAAKVTGKTSGQICAIKEKGIDLLNPQGREAQSIAIYYKHLISYVIKNFITKFKELQGNIELPNKIPCILAGGTSLPLGFLTLVQQAINKEKGFPFPISEVRLATDQLNSIAKGLLIMAQSK